MRLHGWFCYFISGHERLPIGVNFRTHGFRTTFDGHPDFQIVVNAGQQTCHNIFINLAERVRGGERFEHGKSYPGIIKRWDVLMHAARDGGDTLLRIILPDPEGKVLKGEMTGALKFQYMDLDDRAATTLAVPKG